MRNPVKALCGFLPAVVTITLLLGPSAASADVIILDNGNEIRGKILKKTDTHLVVSLPFGRMDIPLRQVTEVREEEESEYLRHSGERLARSEDPSQGIALLREALRANPQSKPCHQALVSGLARGAQKALEHGDLQRADAWVQEAEGLAPSSELVRLVRADYGKLARARDTWQQEAEMASQTGDFFAAHALYLKLIDRFPLECERYRKPFARASLVVGHVHLSEESFELASQAYHQALSNDPDLIALAKSPLGYADVKRAIPLLEQGRFEHAVKLLSSTLDLLVDDPAVIYHLGLAWEGRGDLEQAALLYQQLAGPEGKTINAHSHLASLRENAERVVFQGQQDTELPVQQRWTQGKAAGVHETAHFRIHYFHPSQGSEVGRSLEHHWGRYSKRWLRKLESTVAEKKVDIFLYADHAEYLARSSAPEWSHGVTRNEQRYQVMVAQAVHFDASHPQFLTATLPHELVHVALPHRLGARELPKWLDEGIATAEEPQFKQHYFDRVVRDADQAGQLFPLEELFRAEQYPPKNRISLFYAQSNSIVRYLRQHLGDDGLLQWAAQLAADGLEDAVRGGTRFSSVRALEVAWKRDMVRNKERVR